MRKHKGIDNGRIGTGLSLIVSWGKYGGWYYRKGYTRRLCLGRLALTILPDDIDKLLYNELRMTNKVTNTVKLSNGQTAVMFEAKAGHFFDAQKVAFDTTEIVNELLVMLVTIDGRQITHARLKWLPLADYVLLSNLLSDQTNQPTPDKTRV